ncbi:hypothetical protein [Pollutibacter soli]|uniref:hypothetical protein n=1 Tax=Pollutibacter soli TaxID=3034157 RepID=UPI003013A0D7
MKKVLSVMTGFLLFAAASTQAQKLKLVEGDLSVLENETALNIQFSYDNMSVGKFDKESEYIAKKTEEYNKKEPGRGDNWAKNWVLDRKDKFEPKFNELFEREFEKTITYNSKTPAKYTLIFRTIFTEPGFNVGVMRKNAQIDAEVLVVETANPAKVIAKIKVDNALGRTFGGYDFDTGGRIMECYADAGKALGKYFRKSTKG